MKPTGRFVLIAAGLAAGYGLVRHFRKPAYVYVPSTPSPLEDDAEHGPTTGDWINPNAPAEIRALAAPIEQLVHWPNLGNFLAAISYVESRGNNNAGPEDDSNKARGWFGGRPQSMKTEAYGFSDPNILHNKAASVALAADYAVRLRHDAADGQFVDWLAIRRGWAFPKLVKDVDNSERPELVSRFKTGLTKVGLPYEFMYLPAFPDDFEWPGFAAAYAAMGIA